MQRALALARMVFRQPGYLGLLTSNLAFGMAISFVVPFMSLWGTVHVHMTPVAFGIFMTLTSVSAIVLSTVLARWSDTHVTRRTMLIVGSCGGILGYLGYAFVLNPLALTVIGCTALAVSAVNFSQLFAFMREELARPENAGVDGPFLMTVLRVSFSLAWTVGPAIGAYVMVRYGYHGIFLGAAGLFVIFLLGVLRYVPSRPHSAHARAKVHASMASVLMRPAVWISVTAFLLVFAAHSINMMNLPLMVTQQLGGNERNVGIIFSIAPFAEMPLMLWTGHLAARGLMMRLLRIGAVATVIYFLALTFVHAPWHIYPMQILSAVSIAILTNITILFFQDLLPAQTGMATSLFTNAFNGGNLLGYFAFGVLVGPLGHRGMFVVCAALALTTTVILLCYRQHSSTPAVPVEIDPLATHSLM